MQKLFYQFALERRVGLRYVDKRELSYFILCIFVSF